VDPKPAVSAALRRLALALVDDERAQAALQESARRLAARESDPAQAAFARCEVRARRTRLHLRLAVAHLDAARREFRDDQRRVPARFRRRRSGPWPTLDLVGHRDSDVDSALQRVVSD
jgi:hypothetical protein